VRLNSDCNRHHILFYVKTCSVNSREAYTVAVVSVVVMFAEQREGYIGHVIIET